MPSEVTALFPETRLPAPGAVPPMMVPEAPLVIANPALMLGIAAAGGVDADVVACIRLPAALAPVISMPIAPFPEIRLRSVGACLRSDWRCRR